MEDVNYRAFKEDSQGGGTGENIIKYMKGVTTMVGYLISITMELLFFLCCHSPWLVCGPVSHAGLRKTAPWRRFIC